MGHIDLNIHLCMYIFTPISTFLVTSCPVRISARGRRDSFTTADKTSSFYLPWDIAPWDTMRGFVHRAPSQSYLLVNHSLKPALA